MPLEQHIEELRIELSACVEPAEAKQIAAELTYATALLATREAALEGRSR